MNLCGHETCQIEVFGRQRFCSADHRKAASGTTGSREAEKASARERYSQRHHASERRAKLWPCRSVKGSFAWSKPRDVCSGCRPESQLISIKVTSRAVDDFSGR